MWDLDLVDSLEPAYKLGKKGSKKKGITRVGHKDAVLSLSWNSHVGHVLASGSADHSALVGDLTTAQVSYISNFVVAFIFLFLPTNQTTENQFFFSIFWAIT